MISENELQARENAIVNRQNHEYTAKLSVVVKALSQDISKKNAVIQKDITALYKDVAYKQFQQVFYETYGENYNVESVNESLSFSVDNKLNPVIKYNVKDFFLDKDLKNSRETFNQNVKEEGKYSNLLSLSDLKSLENMGYSMTYGSTNPYEQSTQFTPLKDAEVFKQKKILVNPKSIYEEAKVKTNETFLNKYSRTLANYLLKKYNIKYDMRKSQNLQKGE